MGENGLGHQRAVGADLARRRWRRRRPAQPFPHPADKTWAPPLPGERAWRSVRPEGVVARRCDASSRSRPDGLYRRRRARPGSRTPTRPHRGPRSRRPGCPSATGRRRESREGPIAQDPPRHLSRAAPRPSRGRNRPSPTSTRGSRELRRPPGPSAATRAPCAPGDARRRTSAAAGKASRADRPCDANEGPRTPARRCAAWVSRLGELTRSAIGIDSIRRRSYARQARHSASFAICRSARSASRSARPGCVHRGLRRARRTPPCAAADRRAAPARRSSGPVDAGRTPGRRP